MYTTSPQRDMITILRGINRGERRTLHDATENQRFADAYPTYMWLLIYRSMSLITLLLPRIVAPYLQNTKGMGIIKTNNPPHRDPAAWGDIAAYMLAPARGSVAPKMLLMTALLAMALAV
jgi:hypothetical protein